MSHLSYSQVDTLLSCGEKYRLTRIVGIPEDPAWWFRGGSAVHTATEWFDIGGSSHLPAAELFERALDEQLTDVDESTVRAGGRASKDYPDGENRDWWMDNGPVFVQAWIDWREQNPNLALLELPGAVPGVEVAVTALSPDGVALKGYIDRIFVDIEAGQLLIVDLKTGRNTPPSSLQLDFYRYALSQTLGLHADFGGYWMARRGTLDKVHTLWRSDQQIEAMLRLARTMIDGELFIPHLTSLCGSCGVKEHCSAYTPTTITNTTVSMETV